MDGKIVRIGAFVFHLKDHVIIKDNAFYNISGTYTWDFLELLIEEYPDPVLITTLEKRLNDLHPGIDANKVRVSCVTEIRKILGETSILNRYSHSYFFSQEVVVSEVRQDEYDALYYECSNQRSRQHNSTQKKSGRPIIIKYPDGSKEELYLIKSFGIVDINKDFVILTHKQSSSQKYTKVFISEVVERKKNEFEIIGIDSSKTWAAVRLALLEMTYDGGETAVASSNLSMVEQLVNRKSSIERKFLEYPHTRKYFFEDRDKMPDNPTEYQQVIAIANMFSPLFFEIESTANKGLPTPFRDWFLNYERNIYFSKAIEEANRIAPENWLFINSKPS